MNTGRDLITQVDTNIVLSLSLFERQEKNDACRLVIKWKVLYKFVRVACSNML